MTDELKAKLLRAETAEEAAALLKEAGVDAPQAERIWNEICAAREDKALSLDELESVSGGAGHLDYLVHGCAATVEPGSDCWGVDGGCTFSFIEYRNMPTAYCEDCGRPCLVEETYDAGSGLHRKTIRCHYCNKSYEYGWWDE